MKGLFVFTAGKKEARAHIGDSISSPVSLSSIENHFNQNERTVLEAINKKTNGLYAWGAVPGPRNIPNWEMLNIGDIILTVYDNSYQFISRVVWKTHNASAAQKIWGDDEGKTWEYMYFLSQPIQLKTLPTVDSISDDLNSAYRGFWRFNEEKLQQLQQKYGSIDQFVEERFGVAVANHYIPMVEIEQARLDEDWSKAPASTDDEDLRKRVFREIVHRQGQPAFRRKLISAYGGRCAITDCPVESVLEAAHIVAYNGEQSNIVTNGLLLRADIHTLYDLGLINVNPQFVVEIASSVAGTGYDKLNGKKIKLPEQAEHWPSVDALHSRQN
jgi:hypothetical protein